MSTTPATFEVGKTYWTRSVCDHDCIFTITVASRSAKFITTTAGKRLGVKTDDTGREYVFPHGRYSMAAIIGADKCEEVEPPVDTWAQATAEAERRRAIAASSNVVDLATYRAARAA